MRSCTLSIASILFTAMCACHSLLISPVNHVHHLSSAKCTAIVAPRITLLSTAQAIETTERIESITSDAIVDNDQLAQELGSAFAQKLMELETYRRENGNCIVPKRYEQNQPLGNWVNKQRQNYRKFLNGENSSMIQKKRIDALNKMGFVWDASSIPQTQRSSYSDKAWKKMFRELEKFHQTNEHCRVPSSSPLGQWVVRMRFLYRQDPPGKAKLTLTQERIDLLNSINFAWSTRSEELWEKRVSDLRKFKQKHGHCLVPRNYSENPKLSAWVATQRKNYNRKQAGKTSPLTEERIRELDKMGFVWSYWDHNFMSSDFNVKESKFEIPW